MQELQNKKIKQTGSHEVHEQNGMICLVDLGDEETGVIMEIAGGNASAEKLQAMGIRPGSKIKKVCNMRGHGPVVILCGRTQVAIGRRMAEKINVKEDHGSSDHG